MSRARIRWRIAGGNGDSGSAKCDDWQEAKSVIDRIRLENGSISIDIFAEYPERKSEMFMQKTEGLFFLSVHFYRPKKDMKYMWDTTLPDDMVDWGGGEYSRRTLSDDHDFAEEMFRQYFYNGDVVSDILR